MYLRCYGRPPIHPSYVKNTMCVGGAMKKSHFSALFSVLYYTFLLLLLSCDEWWSCCSLWADVFSTIWTRSLSIEELPQTSSVLTSLTGHGWLSFRGNDKAAEATVHRPSRWSVTNISGLELWKRVLDQRYGTGLFNHDGSPRWPPDRCCLWQMLGLVQMFNIRRRWSCVTDVAVADVT